MGVSPMPFAFRMPLLSLALSLSLTSPVFTQSQSSPSAPNASQASAESAMRAVVEKYFALYTGKDLEGLMSLWSEKSPDYASIKQNFQQQFTTEDYHLSLPTISRVKVEGEKASLRATVNLTTIELNSHQQREQRLVRNFALVQEDGKWRVWRSAPAENDLAEELVKATTDVERTRLLAEEKELVTAELVRSLNSQGARLRDQRNFPQALAVHR